MTHIFYGLISLAALAPLLLAWDFFHKAKTKGWMWSSEDSRNAYVDGLKTMITAAGIAVALLASNYSSGVRTTSNLISFSAKFAAVTLIACVCLSMVGIILLLRGHERAKSRRLEELKETSHGPVIEGKLLPLEFGLTVAVSSVALSCFLVGFIFVGRIVYHF